MSAATACSQLLATFRRVVGAESATLELRWMREALTHGSSSSRTLDSMLERRIRGEPLQYILGTQPFGPLSLLTRAPTLIPRPETEDWTLRLASLRQPTRSKPISVLDLCTGSGCIPLLLCHLWPAGSILAYGIDISEDAIHLAQDNAAKCNISVSQGASDSPAGGSPRDQNTFTPILADMRNPGFLASAGLSAPFDVITSNPPYISRKEYDELPSSVRDFEDRRALLGDPDSHSPDCGGLTFYNTIADLLGGSAILKPGGIVALEVGDRQAGAVSEILKSKARMKTVEIWKDPWEKERVVVATN